MGYYYKIFYAKYTLNKKLIIIIKFESRERKLFSTSLFIVK